jgi:omega-amidase
LKKEKLKITMIQANLHWENPEANRVMFAENIKNINEDTDLVVLPEMFTTGFTMNAAKNAEATEATTCSWLKAIAAENDCAITGSLIVKDQGKFYNRLYFVTAGGAVETYDKKHTFTLAGEHKTYAAGKNKVIVNYKGWRICPLICYDLRFPVWSRNTEDYDLLLYVANWPEKRIAAWDTLLKARAIENMSYCIGVNRVGLDGNDHSYIGHSAAYDVLGGHISTQDFEREFVETITLTKEHIETNRKHLQFLNDRDAFSLK